jgi:phosphopantothenoylcysteine decarboxylase / phosphopantothenate---cysteine ligase
VKNLVLGVSGSVAAYRAADIARELMRKGFVVRVCLTDSAQKFVQPALFEALTGQPCLIDTFEEPERGRMAHIDWARSADVILIAPATANTLNKIAFGIGDDMLTTIALATSQTMLVAPAMNPQMYANENTQESIYRLSSGGVTIIEPTEGDVACGENGQGKLASIQTIVDAVLKAQLQTQSLEGKKILISSGPTAEPIDDVRYITNRSSGKMGAALARAALQMGAEVTVVAGPQRAAIPIQATTIRIQTAEQMQREMLSNAETADLIIGAAAVADYQVANPTKGKIRRSAAPIQLELIPNEDIIAAVSSKFPTKRVIGFAAEPTQDLSIAKAKIQRKKLYAIAANDVSDPSIGFDSESNILDLVFADGTVLNSGKMSKLNCAFWLLKEVTKDWI